jgi:glucokinase
VVRLVEGVTGDAGHIVVDSSSDERCPVGCRGCLETVASGTAIARAARRAVEVGLATALAANGQTRQTITAADVAVAARAGDRVALGILQEAGRWLGVGLASMAPLYAPDLVIVGGGVSGAGDVWLKAAAEALREHGMPHYSARISIRTAVLGPQAGVIGAGLMAWRMHEQKA